ncbi:MAG: chain-length determining protein, partial [Prevotella histicola]
MGNNNIATIDLRLIVKRIIKEKYVFLIVLSLSLIFSALYIWNEPRYYTTDTKLAPEIDNSNSSGTLGTL